MPKYMELYQSFAKLLRILGDTWPPIILTLFGLRTSLHFKEFLFVWIIFIDIYHIIN